MRSGAWRPRLAGMAIRARRQSYFDDRANRRFDDTGRFARQDIPAALVRRFGSLNGLATHDEVLVVGGYVGGSLRRDSNFLVPPVLAVYSSAGRDGLTGFGPGRVHCAAPSDQSLSFRVSELPVLEPDFGAASSVRALPRLRSRGASPLAFLKMGARAAGHPRLESSTTSSFPTWKCQSWTIQTRLGPPGTKTVWVKTS